MNVDEVRQLIGFDGERRLWARFDSPSTTSTSLRVQTAKENVEILWYEYDQAPDGGVKACLQP